MQSAEQPQPASKPTVALVGIDQESAELFRTAFQQFGIETEALDGDPRSPLTQRHFDGCVIRLNTAALALLEAMRSSRINRNTAIVGIAEPGSETHVTKLGLNAILKAPLQKAEVARAVQGTHLLILHELRRYVRVPIVLEVALDIGDGPRVTGLTRDVSYGGLSISTLENVYPDAEVEASFTLPDGGALQVRGSIVWKHNPELIGLRFATDDARRKEIRNWIDDYLEMH